MTLVTKKFNQYRGLGNACPVCASISGKCKWQDYELVGKERQPTATTKVFCMEGAGGYGNPDYHYFNDTRDGQWGIYIPLADWNIHRDEYQVASQADRDRWNLERSKRRQALVDLENQRRAAALGSRERDTAARAIMAQLSLDPVDRQDLLRRGFTPEQIRAIGFKSVSKWQKLSVPVNNRFPGVNIDGTKLSTSIAGVLIPLYAVTGEILGFQVRNRDKSEKLRYVWLSSANEKGRSLGSSPNLASGENPLTFIYPQLLGVELRVNSIGLAEGTGAKPNLAAILMGQLIIGAAGGQWLSSPKLLKDGLQRLRADSIDLYLDKDDLTKPQVLRRWLNLYDRLAEWGYRPRFVWCGCEFDIDESKDINNLHILKRELLQAKLDGLLDRTEAKIEPVSWSRTLYRQSKVFTANQSSSSRYLSWEIPEDLQNALVAFRSALGTGKTEILKTLAVWAKARGLELLFVGYRNNLLRQTCDRIPDLMHVVDEDRIILESDYHKALCHHSAGLLDPDRMANKIVIFDECVSVFTDMLTSKLTAGRHPDGRDSRQVRLKQIQELVKNSYAVVVLDAYLSDTEVDFLQQLRSFAAVYTVENTYQNCANVRMVNCKSTINRAIIDDALAGLNILVTATTQKQCQNLEKALIRVGIPAHLIRRIDSTTDRDEQIRLFFRDPKTFLLKYRPQIVIMSPTAESGISIDLAGYFQTHYHFHLGNLGILSGLQFLGRYRDFSAPRVIFCEEKGRIDDSNSSSVEKWVKDSFDARVKEDIQLALTLLDLNLVDEATGILSSYSQTEDVWLKLAHKYKGGLNEEMKHLRELFVEAMVADGYQVTIDPEGIEGCDDTHELMGQVETERRVVQSRRIYEAPDLTKVEYELIRQNAGASEYDRLLASKHYLTHQQLPGVMGTASYSPELIQIVKYNYPTLIQELEVYYYLRNPHLAYRDRLAAWLPAISTGSVWLPDRISRSVLPLVNAGRKLGLHELLGREFRLDEIDRIASAIIESQIYRSALRVNINEKKPPEPIELFKRVIKKFGLKLDRLGDDGFQLIPVATLTITLNGAPKYDLLTPELCDRIRGLAGSEYHKDRLEMRLLGKALTSVGIADRAGRMRSIAGAARYLGLSVSSRRHRKKIDGVGKVIRIYSFHAPGTLGAKDLHPISTAIANTQVYPTDRSIELKHIYECVSIRLTGLAERQATQIIDWQAERIRLQSELYAPIQVDPFADIDKINLSRRQCGSSIFSLENIKSVAQSLYYIAKMPVLELQQAWGEYRAVIDADVIEVGLDLLRDKYSMLFDRLKLTF
ncbi:plasmid replication protein, CyRepA1 family [Chamaesiphon sp.]|uniref:plasmid replication protein, CyRepA1 family n=1 Tax=Chamaesiphon sp. TaxID=2814140 RepID=UPI003593B8B4